MLTAEDEWGSLVKEWYDWNTEVSLISGNCSEIIASLANTENLPPDPEEEKTEESEAL